jgi:HlyD family secretion protein
VLNSGAGIVHSSAAAELGPTPAPSPNVPEAPSSKRRSRVWVWLVAALAVLGAVLGAGLALRARTRGNPLADVHTATAVKKDFVRSLRVTGTTEATQSYIVSAPTLTGGGLSTLIITRMAQAGAHAKKGDLLVEFDRQNQIKNALDREAEYRDLLEQIKKKQAEQAVARARDETELQQAEDAVKSAELETRRNEVVSRIDAEKNIANLDEARARYQQLQQTFQLKRQAAAAELRILEIQRDRAYNAMNHASANSEKMAIRSPLDGVVVLNTIWKSGQMGEVQEGDEVRPGVPFMQVMNPGSMQVRARLNQADVPVLTAGQPVTIRLDAYPGLILNGKLERVGAIGLVSSMSQKMRTFNGVFSIQGSDPRLMPDLSAAIDIEMQRVPGALLIPRDALYTDAGGAFVWVKHGQSFDREAVNVGAVSDDDAAVVSGLRAGDVVLRNPKPPQEEKKPR